MISSPIEQQIVIRTDASRVLGTGHVMRCLALADQLSNQGAQVTFICREFPGHLMDYIKQHGYPVLRLDESNGRTREGKLVRKADWEWDAEQTGRLLSQLPQIDWLVVDHYELDWRWQRKVRTLVQKVLVIDDLANRKHECDALLDQNLYENMEHRYAGLIPKHCHTFFGPAHVLLREEFEEARKTLKTRDGKVERILISFGGVDQSNETIKAVRAVESLGRAAPPGLTIDVVVGKNHPNKHEIAQYCAAHPRFTYHCQINYMAGLMKEADLMIGAGGSTTWERCLLGLPSITLITADNQIELTKEVEKAAATCNLGLCHYVTSARIADELQRLLSQPNELKLMSQRAQSLMAKGNHPSLIDYMLSKGGGRMQMTEFKLKPLEEKELDLVLRWRNAPQIREHMFTDHQITKEEHYAWFEKNKLNNDQLALLFVYKNQPLGFVHFSQLDRKNGTCSWGFYIGEQNRPPKSGTAMGYLALTHLFDTYGMSKLYAEVLDSNVISLRYHHKMGFREEGRLRKQWKKRGRLVDVIVMALNKEQWAVRRKQLSEELSRTFGTRF